jgi:hypothetical protein
VADDERSEEVVSRAKHNSRTRIVAADESLSSLLAADSFCEDIGVAAGDGFQLHV